MMIKPRFGSRTILILFIVMSVWLAKWTNQARRQRQAIVEIERVGGSVYFGESIFASIPYVDDVFSPCGRG